MASWKTSFLFLSLLALCGCNQELYHGLSEKDANEMLAILQQHGITATRELADGGQYKLSVDDSHFADSIDILKRVGYPHEAYRTIADIFPGDGLVTTPFEQRARMTYALDQELAHTLSQIDGITNARVHVVLPETDSQKDSIGKPTASIVAIVRPGIDKADITPKIRQIVSNSVSGLNFKDVSVAFFNLNGIDNVQVNKIALKDDKSNNVTPNDNTGSSETASTGSAFSVLILLASAVLIFFGFKLGFASIFQKRT